MKPPIDGTKQKWDFKNKGRGLVISKDGLGCKSTDPKFWNGCTSTNGYIVGMG
jgi:hypothetical protein